MPAVKFPKKLTLKIYGYNFISSNRYEKVRAVPKGAKIRVKQGKSDQPEYSLFTVYYDPKTQTDYLKHKSKFGNAVYKEIPHSGRNRHISAPDWMGGKN